MGDELRHRPVEMTRIAGRQPLRRQALRLQAPRAQEYFKFDVEGAGCLIEWIEQVGEGCGVLRGTRWLRRPEGCQRFRGDDPWRYGRAKILAQKGAERLIL